MSTSFLNTTLLSLPRLQSKKISIQHLSSTRGTANTWTNLYTIRKKQMAKLYDFIYSNQSVVLLLCTYALYFNTLFIFLLKLLLVYRYLESYPNLVELKRSFWIDAAVPLTTSSSLLRKNLGSFHLPTIGTGTLFCS